MEVHGVGPTQGGVFPASGGIPPEPGASLLADQVRARLEALKGMAIDLIGDVLSDAHLGEALEQLGEPADPTRLMAARALVAEQGRLDPVLLKEVERGLSRLAVPGEPVRQADAAAVAFLVVRRLPVTPETAQLVLERQDPSQTSGDRLKLLVEKVSLQWGPEDESALPSDTQPSRVPRLADGLERLFAALPPERRPALAEALSHLLTTFAPEADESPEAPQAAAQAAPVASQASMPEGAALPRPALHEVILQTYRALAPAQQPAFEEALDTLLRAFAAEAGVPEEALAEEVPLQPAPLSPKAEALARLQALALPEGGRHQVEAALRRLVTAMTPPEADLAQALQASTPEEEAKQTAMPRERLAEVLERVVDRHPADPDARALRDEVRFGQMRTAGNEGLVFTIPLWWSRGSGEIRVHERQGEGDHAAGGPSGSTRVVIALDTPHLRGVRIDLLLRERQVNCQVALEDPAAASFLEPRLPELREAIEGIGIRVGSLNLRKAASPRKAPGTSEANSPSRLPGVDFYG